MTFDEYQEAALRTRTRAPGEELDPKLDLAVMALGCAGEAGEVADLIKKHLGHGKALTRDVVAKELGDVLWYIVAVADCFDLDLEQIAELNAEKLRKRYPDGFSHKASAERTE